MDNFKGNSTSKKPNPEKEKPSVITTDVSVKKTSEFKKFKNNFFAEDAKTVKGQVFTTVIIPGLQRLFKEIVNTAVDVLLYGGRTRDPRETRAGYVSYSSPYNRTHEYNKIPETTYSRNFFAVSDVVIYKRGETEEVLMSLKDQIDRYGMVSVADFYDMIGQSAPYTANKYGWRDLSGASIDRNKDGYSIIFPKPIPLE